MSNEQLQDALDEKLAKQRQTWGEERIRNLGATVESLMRRRGFEPDELDQFDQDEDSFELAA